MRSIANFPWDLLHISAILRARLANGNLALAGLLAPRPGGVAATAVFDHFFQCFSERHRSLKLVRAGQRGNVTLTLEPRCVQ